MLYATPTAIACMIAIWFCYWIGAFFPSLRSRPSRVACIALPVVLSALLLAFPTAVLDPISDFMNGAPLVGLSRFDVRGGAAIASGIAILLSTFTLLIAALIGQVLSPTAIPR